MALPKPKPAPDQDSGSDDGLGDIIAAAKQGDVNTVAAILRANPGAINEVDSAGFTPLHCGCFLSDLPLVQLLLAQPNIDCRLADKWGRWPVHYSYASSSNELKKLIDVATFPPRRTLEVV